MSRFLFGLALLAFGLGSGVSAQDDLFDSGLPRSKQAMLVVDLALEDIIEDSVMGPFADPRMIAGFGPPIDFEDYQNVKRVTVMVGVPDIRMDAADFVARIKVKDPSTLPQLANKMFGFGRGELESRVEGGWTILKSGDRWPDVIRYRDDLLEFGTSLYTYTPSKALVSPSLAKSFSAMEKTATLRTAFDAQVLGNLIETVMKDEGAQEEAVYQMIKWGNFINEPSIALYGASILKELKTASLSVDLSSDTLGKISIVPVSGKEESVKAKAQVLYQFLMFHVNLPIKTLKQKENPVADILQKIADGMELSTTGPSFDLTMAKPKDLSKDLLAIVDRMKVSFSDREDSNLMKMLGLAAHNYHDSYRRFPYIKNPAEGDRFSADLSWRVRVLPYCEFNNEYDQMDLTQGWDAKANQSVVAKCKDAFVLSNGALICAIKTDPPAVTFGSILDGTSNTIMLIENRSAAMTPWTKPLDLTIDEAVKSVVNLKKGDSLWVGMYDGSVMRLASPKDTGFSEKDIRNLFDPRDGNVTRMMDMREGSSPRLFPNIERPRRGRGGFPRELKKDEAFDAPKAALPRLIEKAEKRDDKS